MTTEQDPHTPSDYHAAYGQAPQLSYDELVLRLTESELELRLVTDAATERARRIDYLEARGTSLAGERDELVVALQVERARTVDSDHVSENRLKMLLDARDELEKERAKLIAYRGVSTALAAVTEQLELERRKVRYLEADLERQSVAAAQAPDALGVDTIEQQVRADLAEARADLEVKRIEVRELRRLIDADEPLRATSEALAEARRVMGNRIDALTDEAAGLRNALEDILDSAGEVLPEVPAPVMAWGQLAIVRARVQFPQATLEAVAKVKAARR